MVDTIEKAFISERAGLCIVDFLADEVGLSKAKIKDCLIKGGVWLKRDDLPPERVKQAKTQVKLDDEIHIYYDALLLKQKAPLLSLVEDHQQYSIWMQPEGLMTQVSLYSDHLMLDSVLLKSIAQDRDCFLLCPSVRLDSGLLLLVHTRNAAARFQQMEDDSTIVRQLELKLFGRLSALSSALVDLSTEGDVSELKVTTSAAVLMVVNSQEYELDIEEIIQEFMQDADSADFSDRTELSCMKLQFTCPLTGELRQYQV
ncbi:MAG: hypothetical protein HRU20_31925 [Pseudomonadales bacterium]|nr:hypothetical protein [Pseudomonadales bacterium]